MKDGKLGKLCDEGIEKVGGWSLKSWRWQLQARDVGCLGWAHRIFRSFPGASTALAHAVIASKCSHANTLGEY